SSPSVSESGAAKRVTSCPKRISSRVSSHTSPSMLPAWFWRTGHSTVAIWAIRINGLSFKCQKSEARSHGGADSCLRTPKPLPARFHAAKQLLRNGSILAHLDRPAKLPQRVQDLAVLEEALEALPVNGHAGMALELRQVGGEEGRLHRPPAVK